MIKVVVTGSESTGKTNLARQLGAHFDAPVSQEFVREFAARRAGALALSDHGPIARGQISSEDAAIARGHDLVILDTDLVSTVVYCEHYFGQCPAWIADQATARAGQLYLLLAPDVPWMPDGVRDRGERRDEMHGLFEAKLTELGLPYITISGSWPVRFEAARDAIDGLRR